MELEIKFIRTDGGTQARAKLDPDTVDDYRDILRDSDSTWPFPPVVVFHDGSTYWLADGFHRVAAARQHGRFVCEADVRQGTQRDAILYAAGANADHGLRRTNEDKRRAVLRLLEDAEWGQWSDREIARRCHVSPTFVGFLRREVADTVHVDSMDERKFVHPKTGETAVMKTGNIGGNGSQPPRKYLNIGELQAIALDWLETVNDGPRGLPAFLSHLDDRNELYIDTAAESGLSGARIIRAQRLRAADAAPTTEMTAVERQTQLNERAYYWLAEYTDQWDRTWRELEPNQVHHANSPCYQAFVRQFPSDRDHKFALKSALARLVREDADGSNIAVFDDPVDAIRAHATKGSRSAESVYRTLASFDASGHEYAMGLAIEDTGLPPSDIRQAAAELLAELESTTAELMDALEGTVETAVSPAPIVETYNGTDYRRETITNAHGQTETRWQPVAPAPSLVDGPLNQMRQALSLMKYPGDHARVFRQWQQSPDTKREDAMMFGAIARLIEILVDELEADREVSMT